MTEPWYRWHGADLIVRVRVQPRASGDEWLEPVDGPARVRITAPPVDGKANAHLRKFLASLFDVAQSQVMVLAGETGRDKRLRIIAPRRLPPGIQPADPPGPVQGGKIR